MKRKGVLGIVLTLLFLGMLTLVFQIQPVKAWAGGTIIIRANGDVDCSTADPPISSGDLITYTLTDDIVSTPDKGSAIVIERDDIVLNGAEHAIQGAGGLQDYGINVTGRSGVTIKNMTIDAFVYAIFLNNSDNNLICGNEMTSVNAVGIRLDSSSGNNITRNTLTCGNNSIHLESSYSNRIKRNDIKNGGGGIGLASSSINLISGNNITNNVLGVMLFDSSQFNTFYHNNFIGNTIHVYGSTEAYRNFWCDVYPSGGNYWDDQPHGFWDDIFAGPGQDVQYDSQPTPDGIADDPYPLDLVNSDEYPLMNPRIPRRTSVKIGNTDYPVVIDSNTEISDPDLRGSTLHFTSSGTGDGYILVIFPKLGDNPPSVQIDGDPPDAPFPIINDNGTHWFIYFEFSLSTHIIEIKFLIPVGGIWIPVDKFSLLAPYITLVSTIILALAASAAYIKHRKKQ